MSDQLSKKLREIRESRGLGTIEDAAAKLGSSRRTVGDYERGHRLPDIDYLAKFAVETGADVGELIALRLAAGGHEPPLILKDEPDEPYHVPDDLGPLRSRLALSVMPPEWSMFLTELVLRGKISQSVAEEFADFFDAWQPSRRWLELMEEYAK